MPHADPDIKRAYHRNYMRERYRHDRAHRERAKSHTATSAKRRRQQMKARLDEIRAAGCSRCGATPDTAEIHFHHIDPASKRFEIANWRKIGATESELLAEIEKCQLLCRECHSEEHQSPCGTRAAYKRGCRCEDCRQAQSDYARAYRRSRIHGQDERHA